MLQSCAHNNMPKDLVMKLRHAHQLAPGKELFIVPLYAASTPDTVLDENHWQAMKDY
jgi:hypothetical protein